MIVGINDRHRVKRGAQVVETLSTAVESSSRYRVVCHQSISDCESVTLPICWQRRSDLCCQVWRLPQLAKNQNNEDRTERHAYRTCSNDPQKDVHFHLHCAIEVERFDLHHEGLNAEEDKEEAADLSIDMLTPTNNVNGTAVVPLSDLVDRFMICVERCHFVANTDIHPTSILLEPCRCYTEYTQPSLS